jgi:Holliday junction resolvase RusA-like endonuclease
MNEISTVDRPFALPPRELVTVVLDLLPPPSVNRTRRMDRRGQGILEKWQKNCHKLVMAQGRRKKVEGAFALHVLLDNKVRLDGDNGLKAICDYLRHIEIIKDDSPRYMRRITVEWGYAPEGCRVTVTELC